MALQALSHLLKGIRAGAGIAFAKVATMVSDKNLKTTVLFYLTFANFFINMYSAVTKGSGNKFILAFESLGITLGGSVRQIVVGLSTMLTPEVGLIKWLTALATVLLGSATIYYWYKGNLLFIDVVSANDPRLTDWIYITAVFILAVIAFQDANYFFEATNLIGEIGTEAANTARDAGVGDAINKTNSTIDFFSN